VVKITPVTWLSWLAICEHMLGPSLKNIERGHSIKETLLFNYINLIS